MRMSIAAMLLFMPAAAFAQERTFTVTLPESQWNTLAKIVSKSKMFTWEETNPIITGIGAQIQQQLQADATSRNSSAAEIARLQSELDAIKKPPEPKQ